MTASTLHPHSLYGLGDNNYWVDIRGSVGEQVNVKRKIQLKFPDGFVMLCSRAAYRQSFGRVEVGLLSGCRVKVIV